MNRTYSIVWSAVRNMYVVASELARGHSKVKIQAHANEVALSIEKPESGWTISAKHNALAFAIVAALGFASPLAMADNPVSYIDGTDHDLNAETSPISYSGTGQGTALYLEGLATAKGGWQPTSGTGTGVVIETDGGGDLLPDGSYAIATAIKLASGAVLNLTNAEISTTGNYSTGIELTGQSSITLTGGTLQVKGNYGIMTLSGESQATLSDIKVTATAETTSNISVGEGSTLKIKDGSEVTLTNGQLSVAGNTTSNAFLYVTNSTVSSTGTKSTVIASNQGILDIKNSTIMHDNAKGAAIEAGNASTVTISGDNKNSMVITSEDIGIKSAKSSVNIDGATIIAKGDGILMTTGGSSFYSNNSGLTVNNADVTSDDAAALHVDKNTVMEKPITLTDSTLTGPTAIKLDNAATVEANNTTLNGNIDAGSTVSSLSLAEKSSLQGSVNGLNSSLTLDETSQWNMTDPSTVGNLTNDGGITLGNASGSTGTLLTVDNTLTLQNGSQINATLDTANSSPIIKAANVTLDGMLNLSSTATFVAPETDEHLGSFTLIDSQTAITTDFDSVTLDADISAMPDYLTINAGVDANDNTNYELSTGLSWYAGANSTRAAHGTFTVDAGSTFTVTSELDETTATSNWDGSKLTKQGDGTLILSNTGNDYGDTEIDGGILAAKDAASLGTGDVTITESATLALSQGTLDNNVTGGGQIVKTGNDELIVTGDNTYSGGTTINEGTLVAASTTALGTGLVDNNATLVLDADGEVSAVGGITTHSGATTQLALGTSLDLGDSALIQQDGSTLNVELNSDSVQPLITGGSATLGGDLVVSDASLQARASDAEFQSFKLMDMDSDISGDFTSLTMNLTDKPDYLTVTGTINPEDASEYLLTEGLSWNATATSATPAHGTFTLGAGDSFEVTSVLGDKTGNGDWDGKSLTKLGAGKLTLSGANTYSGDTNVQEGTLWLSGDGTIGEMGSQQAVNVASDATFGGSNGTTVNGKVTNEGTLVFGDSEETGAILTLNGDLINMGTLASGSSSSTPGNTLYVDGDYTGNGGSLYLNTVLGDDDSATDKLVITGDASGTTDLYINGIGNGAQTTNGIEVVDVGGTSTSDAFVLKNEVNASLYTYRLYWNESDNDWYLASKAQSDDDDSGSDVTPSDDGDDGGNVTPPDDGGDVAPQYRADIGAYMGNQWMARNLQMQTLYDREGSQYRNADGSVWARFKAGKAESEAVSGNIDMDSNYSQFQLGGDILAWGNGQQSVTVGVMASYINADTDSTGNRGADGSQFTSSSNVDGYNLGVYATWFADAQTHSGAYVDSWYQYGFYNNSVESGDAGSESYDSTANAVSLETGYRYDIALSNGNTVSLTPQAQVVWQNYSADSVKDNYGTRIDGQDSDSWTTRLGLRVDGKLYKGSRTVIQPFAEANWLHTSDDVSVSFDDATVKQDLPANRAELKVGLQADIDKQWSVRAQVAGQTGSNDFGDLNGSLNLRYNW
ncbi:autotransporter outer membrane beta-barrel domain-containing protein [Salmonella enterica]|nr:autotransporter outer membrane beta-barrel domain-containing protein [Salmonella enterica]EHE1593854.1 autotransporter outer membrane beta-barrel domain-containing protein [Salmonella enterica]EHE1672567.1 autotransporter outer membrane beta-barrel domain-containing protein [Salmonella enterica]EHE1780249.1 autotransporter outer membrane beta-barrel domain-containing protein [Salmonella enterica]